MRWRRNSLDRNVGFPSSVDPSIHLASLSLSLSLSTAGVKSLLLFCPSKHCTKREREKGEEEAPVIRLVWAAQVVARGAQVDSEVSERGQEREDGQAGRRLSLSNEEKVATRPTDRAPFPPSNYGSKERSISHERATSRFFLVVSRTGRCVCERGQSGDDSVATTGDATTKCHQ